MTFRALCQLVLFVWFACTTTGQFNFCRLLQGQCYSRCQRNYISLFRAPILCPRSTVCCIRDRRRRPLTTIPTTTELTTVAPPGPGCGIGRPVSRIIGGRDAEQCEFPWMVHIYRDQSPCGGSLIDDRHIVTAGHCLSNVAKVLLTVTIGEYDTRVFNPRTEFIEKNYEIFLPPNYSSRYFENDIAIIKLAVPINFGKFGCLAPVCLPEPGRRFRDVSCTVVGWGVTRANYTYRDPPLSPVLKKVNVDIVDGEICRKKFGEEYFRNTNYCAGYLRGGRDSCGGDSGGPLMCSERDRDGTVRQVLAGIVSTGSNCAQKDTPAIYTDVGRYLDWINTVRETPYPRVLPRQ